MNPIRTNKPTFFGNDGDVLKSGQIFIGQPNQWPIDFPKTVTFQDSAGTQFTAQQPLTTNNQGQISYNGKAIIALVDGNYSMLVRDRNGVVVNDGYTPFVENTDSGGGGTTNATQVGTLLSDIKQFNVTPGDTVRNVGKTTALDDLGAYWLVVSNTGSGGDDIDLIDFDNGTQGQRIGNTLYSKDFPGFEYRTETIELDGDFSPGSFAHITRIGQVVTVTSSRGSTVNLPYTSSVHTAETTTDFLPEWARPEVTATNMFTVDILGTPTIQRVFVTSIGQIGIVHYDSAFSTEASSDANNQFNITYKAEV